MFLKLHSVKTYILKRNLTPYHRLELKFSVLVHSERGLGCSKLFCDQTTPLDFPYMYFGHLLRKSGSQSLGMVASPLKMQKIPLMGFCINYNNNETKAKKYIFFRKYL